MVPIAIHTSSSPWIPSSCCLCSYWRLFGDDAASERFGGPILSTCTSPTNGWTLWSTVDRRRSKLSSLPFCSGSRRVCARTASPTHIPQRRKPGTGWIPYLAFAVRRAGVSACRTTLQRKGTAWRSSPKRYARWRRARYGSRPVGPAPRASVPDRFERQDVTVSNAIPDRFGQAHVASSSRTLVQDARFMRRVRQRGLANPLPQGVSAPHLGCGYRPVVVHRRYNMQLITTRARFYRSRKEMNKAKHAETGNTATSREWPATVGPLDHGRRRRECRGEGRCAEPPADGGGSG